MKKQPSRQIIGAGFNGVCAGLTGSVLGFTLTDWQWWLVMSLAIISRITGQVAG